jgi:hypothetical protein
MSTRFRIVAALGITFVLLAGPAQAADSGFYVGAGIGEAKISDDSSQPSGQNFDESSTPYRAFAGYRFGVIPIIDLAAEIGYMDLGKAEGTVGGTTAQYKAQGADGSLLVIFPITIFDLYGRVGVFQAKLDKTFNGTTTSSAGTAGVYGAGVGVRFWRLGVRAEYDRIDIKDLKSVDVGMASIYFQF